MCDQIQISCTHLYFLLPRYYDARLYNINSMIKFFIFLWALLAQAQSQACNSIAISGCASFDTNNTYALADCGCLSCNPGLTLAVGLLSCCDGTFQHCLTCDASNICQACQVNYNLNSSNYCTLCSSSLLNCLTCSNLSTCTSCTANFALNSGVCSACSSLIGGCITCSNASTCSTCQSTHILSANNSCQTCNTSFASCSECTPSGCILCNSYYGLNSSNLCVYCSYFIDYCAYCHDIYSPCLGCHDGRFVNSTLLCDLCSNYMINCSTCPNNSYCYLCQLGYGFNDTHDCVRCDLYFANCSSCFDIHSCTSCISTMVLNDSNICVPCYEFMPNCNTCMSNRTNCSSCNSTGMGLDNSTYPATCVVCSSKFPQCINCTLVTFCTVCINDSYILVWQSVDRQVCLACNQKVQGCYTCTQTSVCLSCLTTKQYLFNSSSNTCVRCSQYLDNCTACNSMFYCIGCQDHRFALARLNNNVNTQVCQLCSDFMLNCLYCQSSTFCSLCLAGQFINSNKGCSEVKGCIEIYPLSPVATNCRSCDPLSFKPTPQNGKCICASGKLVGNQCTSVFGCIGVKVSRGKVVCVSCDRNSKLMLIGQLCECIQYYQLSGQACVQTCGDGYLISYQCDDGNNINGDGCSDKCEIEDSFACRSDNNRYPANPASQCQFKGKIELVLNSIDKTLQPNTVQVIFDIVPYDPKLELMDLMANFNITADACTVISMKISSGQLHVFLEYTKDIQGQPSTISAQFDSQYILSPDFSLSFSMVESNGIPLKYNSNQAINSTIILMAKILSLLALGVFVVGSFAFKMIGLETLFTIQIIWFTLATSKYYKATFAHLHNLNYSYGQISSFLGSDTEVSMAGYKRLGFNGGISDILLLIIFDWGLFICYCGALIYRLIKKKKLEKIVGKRAILAASKFKILKNDCEGKINTSGKIANSIYNWALFPFVIGFQFHFFHTFSLYMLSSSRSHISFQMIMLCLSLVLTSFLFFRELIVRDEECQSAMLRKANRNIYIPNFLAYNLIIFFLMSLLLNNISQLVYFAVIAILSFQAIYVIIFTPYNSNFDNFCLVFNHIAILFNLIWIMIKGLPFYDFFIESLCVYAFTGLSYTVIGLGLIRSLIAIKRTYFPNNPFSSQTASLDTKERPAVAINAEQIIKSKLSIDTNGYDELKSLSPLRKKINRFKTDELNIQQKQSFRHKATRTLIDHP